MIPPDQDISEVEQRIALRRQAVAVASRDSSRRALVALTSPGALIGAAVVGFLAGGFGRREPKHTDRRKDSAKAAKTGIAGAVMSGAMWLVRARFGGPAGLAQFLMRKFSGARRRPAATAPTALKRG